MDSQTILLKTQPFASFDRERLDDAAPLVHLLSNRQMVTMLSAAGSGYVHMQGTALTRWQADRTQDRDGYFIYVRDLESGDFWSSGFQPTAVEPDEYQANFYVGAAQFVRVDKGIRTNTEVCLATDANVELRRCTITNQSQTTRQIELTSYAELVLQDAAADSAHPAFSKLFIQTEYLEQSKALVGRRRKRRDDEATVSACHFLVCDDGRGPDEFETDRQRFIGRGQDLNEPLAMTSLQPLSGSVGSVLDPIASLRRTFILPPNASACVTFFLASGEQDDQFDSVVQRFTQPEAIEEAFAAAREASIQDLANARFDGKRLGQVLKLAATMLYGSDSDQHPPERTISAGSAACEDLPEGISSILPQLACKIEGEADLIATSTLLQSQAFLHRHQVPCNLVLLNQFASREDLDDLVSRASTAAQENGDAGRLGQVQVYESIDFSEEQCRWMYHLNRISSNGDLPSSAEVLSRVSHSPNSVTAPATFRPAAPGDPHSDAEEPASEELQFFNGIGGFSVDGKEYVLRIPARKNESLQLPPMPWVNVIANEKLGMLVTETGAGYTWANNSRENRLTPWYNDPIRDPHGEALYIRDEDAGAYWSLTPGPVPGSSSYEVRHGFGYTVFRHESAGLQQEVVKFVPREDPVSITHVKLCNTSSQVRHLNLFNYHCWELSNGGPRPDQQIHTSLDESRRTIWAANHVPSPFSGRAAFATLVLDSENAQVSMTSDRTEFLGRNGSLSRPQALKCGTSLSGRVGCDLDPCAASQAYIELQPGETIEYAILLGQANTTDEAQLLIDHFSNFQTVSDSLCEVKKYWSDLLSAVQVETPSREINFMVNGWLPYQNLSCRIWGRSAYYQAGGAYGFRDQLQDSAALVHHLPKLTRDQILLHAAHQFFEGDVMHWWHTPTSSGLRTTFSDDLLWLPMIAAEYVAATGDAELWNEDVRFLHAEPLADGEPETFMTPRDLGHKGSVYEHCCRALDRGLTRGVHGLPLMGCGDWNDGMNRVGQSGSGESVWLGFFIDYILEKMLPVCEQFGDTNRLQKYGDYREQLRIALNDAGWDGAWYRRAYFDDGTPLGTAASDECKIDALAQAWAVLSGAAPASRAASALAAAEKHLVDESAGLIRLLDPPFDKMKNDPGYIKGYVPGVRENGGQYTHGVLWFIRALAEQGAGTRATQLLKMLSPVSHGRTREEVATYMAEPYVVAADVYGQPPHTGRAGWSWYTGSAGWMFRVAFETILGIRLVHGKFLQVDPRISADWPECRVRYRLPEDQTIYEITIENPNGNQQGVTSARLDGDSIAVSSGIAKIPLLKDGKLHQVEISL